MRRKRLLLEPSAVRLEPTFSPAEVETYLGLSAVSVQELINLGEKYKSSLHPQHGGLWPTIKLARRRRIPLSAINRHLRHMARLHGEPNAQPVQLVEIKYVAVEEAPAIA